LPSLVNGYRNEGSITRRRTMRTTHWTGIGLFAVMVGFAPLAAWADDGPPDAWITLKGKIAVLTAVGIPGTDINVDAVRGT
jgi:hypothetical protein